MRAAEYQRLHEHGNGDARRPVPVATTDQRTER